MCRRGRDIDNNQLEAGSIQLIAVGLYVEFVSLLRALQSTKGKDAFRRGKEYKEGNKKKWRNERAESKKIEKEFTNEGEEILRRLSTRRL